MSHSTVQSFIVVCTVKKNVSLYNEIVPLLSPTDAEQKNPHINRKNAHFKNRIKTVMNTAFDKYIRDERGI